MINKGFSERKIWNFFTTCWRVWQNFKFNSLSGRFSVHEILCGWVNILLPTFRLLFSVTLTSFDLGIGLDGFKKYLNRIWILPVLRLIFLVWKKDQNIWTEKWWNFWFSRLILATRNFFWQRLTLLFILVFLRVSDFLLITSQFFANVQAPTFFSEG